MIEVPKLVKKNPVLSYDWEDRKKPDCWCPYCHTQNTQDLGTSSTLVGGDPDPNHHWNSRRCRECGEEFTLEYKSGEAWYVDKEHNLLAGMPNCFESYRMDCALCGGRHTVRRIYKELDGSPHKSHCLSTHIFPKQRTFYMCTECGEEEEIDSSRRTYRASMFHDKHKGLIEGMSESCKIMCRDLNKKLQDFIQKELGEPDIDHCSDEMRYAFRELWKSISCDPDIHFRMDIKWSEGVAVANSDAVCLIGMDAKEELERLCEEEVKKDKRRKKK